MKNLRIYSLNDLEPELRAVTFAKCSRSPEPFDQIANELTAAKATEFHEKWVVGYGHSSVAEHAVFSLALENVSILATKVIEDNRLASYTEKSSRYQVFDFDSLYYPAKIINSEFKEIYTSSLNALMQTYLALAPKMDEFCRKKYPPGADENPSAYKIKIKGRMCDNVRYLLPVATLTNLGMTINARCLEHAICKMLSHPLEEIQQIGEKLKQVGTTVCPTLVKYAAYNKYLAETPQILEQEIKNIFSNLITEKSEAVELVEYDPQAVDKILTAILYRYSNKPYQQAKEKIKLLSLEQREKLLTKFHALMDKHDWPLRELEHINYTFDLTMDYGAFRDVQRHRICTQTNQLLGAELGFATPAEIIEAGFQKEYLQAIKTAEYAWDKIKGEFPQEAQYVLPLAYRKRVLINWNLRSLHHFIKLRSGKLGHISYRRIAQKCWEKVNAVHPELAQYIQVTQD